MSYSYSFRIANVPSRIADGKINGSLIRTISVDKVQLPSNRGNLWILYRGIESSNLKDYGIWRIPLPEMEITASSNHRRIAKSHQYWEITYYSTGILSIPVSYGGGIMLHNTHKLLHGTIYSIGALKGAGVIAILKLHSSYSKGRGAPLLNTARRG